MASFRPSVLKLFALGVFFLGHSAALAAIQDNAKFFSKDAIKMANEEIAQIKKLFKKDILIETVQTVPMTNEAAIESGKDMDPVFSDWAKKRLSKTGTKNIYIVVSRKPSYIMAAVGSETRSKNEFTENDRNALIKVLADNFQQRDYNRGLIEGIRFVRGTINNNLQGRPNNYQQVAPPVAENPAKDVTFLWRWIGFGCAGLLALLLITGLIRGFSQPAATAASGLKPEESATPS
jgi:hypothetical protein